MNRARKEYIAYRNSYRVFYRVPAGGAADQQSARSAALLHRPHTQEELTVPNPAPLVRQAEEPPKLVLLHPGVHLLGRAGDEVEIRPHPSHHRHTQSRAILVHPAFLFGRAHAHSDDISRRRVDVAVGFQLLFDTAWECRSPGQRAHGGPGRSELRRSAL